MSISSDRFLMQVLSRQSEPKRSKKVEERIASRMSLGLCLSKNVTKTDSGEIEVDCNKPMGSLGLCDCCRSTYYREASSGTDDDRVRYVFDMRQEGLVLGAGEIRKMKRKSLLFKKRA
jgi:hypothetical protein